MHADEVRATPEQVTALVAAQAPQWTGLPVTRLDAEGTDHVLFRLGQDLLVRMPKIHWATDQAESDSTWLPRIAPHLSVAVPAPRFTGEPGEGFPWTWTVVDWVEGATPGPVECADPALAIEVAEFVLALRAIDPTGGPEKAGTARGAPLAGCDAGVRAAIGRLRDHDDGLDLDAVEAAWDDAVTAPVWEGPPTWMHGDLMPGNLLVRDGRLAAVIDFGAFGVGDPAPDVTPAFWTFTGAARSAYRQALEVDDAMWRRARGWILVPSIGGINYYRTTFPAMAETGRRGVAAVLEDLAGG